MKAILHTGREVELSGKYGQTHAALASSLSDGNLTGSAVPFADVVLDTADGRQVAYGDVEMFIEESSFLPPAA